MGILLQQWEVDYISNAWVGVAFFLGINSRQFLPSVGQVEGNHAVWWELRSRPGEGFGWKDREFSYSSLGG